MWVCVIGYVKFRLLDATACGMKMIFQVLIF